MSSTRYAKTHSNPDDSPERYLSNPKVRGIAIGMNIVARVGRILPEPERSAMYWLTNYAKLRDLTADSLSAELNLEKAEIRDALTNPDADRSKFVVQVKQLRGRFEAGLQIPRFQRTSHPGFRSRVFNEAYCLLADTKIRRKVRNAINFASREAQIVEIIGDTRLGKTVAAAWEFFHRLDHAAWIVVPNSGDERSFLIAVALGLGCTVASNDRPSSLLAKIKASIGPNCISLGFMEEAHRLWPSDLKTQPKRLDHTRDWWEYDGFNCACLATPQFIRRAAEAMEDESATWEVGQWIGRVQVFDLPDSLDDTDLGKIVENHAPEADAESRAQLIAHAKASRGYAGIMVKSIERARFMGDGKLDLETIKRAQLAIDREARQLAIRKGAKK